MSDFHLESLLNLCWVLYKLRNPGCGEKELKTGAAKLFLGLLKDNGVLDSERGENLGLASSSANPLDGVVEVPGVEKVD